MDAIESRRAVMVLAAQDAPRVRPMNLALLTSLEALVYWIPPLWHRHAELRWELSALYTARLAAYDPGVVEAVHRVLTGRTLTTGVASADAAFDAHEFFRALSPYLAVDLPLEAT
jgi:hypothetical protein